jgi:hypothetical protein
MELRGQLHAPTALPQERTTVSIKEDAALAPEAVWTFLEKKHLFMSVFEPRTVQHVG